MAVSVLIGVTSTATVAETTDPSAPVATDGPGSESGGDETADGAPQQDTSRSEASASSPAAPTPVITGDRPYGSPYGAAYPVTLESNFARPYKSISSRANSDFSQLEDLERLIRGSYQTPSGVLRPEAERISNEVLITVSRMENSYRVGRYLIAAAKNGVQVRFIHGLASQSKESRALQKKLNSIRYTSKRYKNKRTAYFKICAKGKSLACLSTRSGAIMHSKMLLVRTTYTQDGDLAYGAVWSGSANLGGPSGERTFNNGLTIYNDKKIFEQMFKLFKHMYSERGVGNDTISYFKKNKAYWGYSQARSKGYTSAEAYRGMFYSNLANVTIYPTPIYATPTNGKDPVLNLLDRVVPDSQCTIKLQQNRFKYRRIAVAYKLAELADGGCKVSIVSFEDDLLVNRVAHCQQYLRVCRPILDVFKTSNTRIEAYWAKPHDKTILVDALLTRNLLNTEEIGVDGSRATNWPAGGVRTKLVQAGSAALTGSNLIVSDEITTETTDAAVYGEYIAHWKAILHSQEIKRYPY